MNTTFAALSRPACAALLLVMGMGAMGPATADPVQDLIKSYGFEYRDGEVPYGVPIKVKLSDVTVGDHHYQIDRASPLDQAGMERAIKVYMVTHAANSVALLSRLYGPPISKVNVKVDKTHTEDLDYPGPPIKSFRVRVPQFVENGEEFDVHCDFNFIKIEAQYYALYFEKHSYGLHSMEPFCDMRGSKTRNPM